MRTLLVLCLALLAVNSCLAEDDGQYRPELYGGDDGQYRPTHEGRYYAPTYSPFYKTVYGANYAGSPIVVADYPYSVTPQPYHQQLLAPIITYNGVNSFDSEPVASSLNAVTLRPPVVASLARTIVPVPTAVYSSTPRPAAAAVVPTVYTATARPIVPVQVEVPVYGRQYAYNNDQKAQARIASYMDKNTYKYAFETDNGINAAETGNADGAGTRVHGFYEYIGSDGQTYRVDYTADENGFRPVGKHLPV